MEIVEFFSVKENSFLIMSLFIFNYDVAMNYMLLSENKASLKSLLTSPIVIIILWSLILYKSEYHTIINIIMIFLINILGQGLAMLIKYRELKEMGVI